MKRLLFTLILWLPLLASAHGIRTYEKYPANLSSRTLRSSSTAGKESSKRHLEEAQSEGLDSSAQTPIWGNPTYKVTINLVYDTAEFTPPIIQWLTPNGFSPRQGTIAGYGMNSVEITVEEGSLDLIAQFMRWYKGDDLPAYTFVDAYAPFSYILLEDIEVMEDTEVTIDLSEATNFIQFSALNNEGEPFKVPLLIIDEQNGTMDWDDSQANVWDVTYNTAFFNNETGTYIMQNTGTYGHVREDGRSYSDAADFYINSLSEKYTVYQNLMAYDSDINTGWSLNLATLANESKVVSNTGNEYTFITQEFQATPARNPEIRESPYGVSMLQYFNTEYAGGYDFKFFGDEIPSFYLGEAADFDCTFMGRSKVVPQMFERSIYDEENRLWITDGIDGCPLTIISGSAKYSNPYNDYFSSNAPHNGWIMGKGAPATYAEFNSLPWGQATVVVPNLHFVGQFGEDSNVDLTELDINVSHDGETVCSNIFDFYDWCYNFAEQEHSPGEVKMTFINNNIQLGDRPAQNITEITYNENNEDLCPPVLQLIRFTQTMRETYGPILDTWLGQLKFSAGDINSNGRWKEYKEANIKVEYAVNGTSDYIELEVKVETPLQENQLPVYLVPLNRLDPQLKSPNGWFDFRFTATDEVGNSMVQTFSPAVYIKNLHNTTGLQSTYISTYNNNPADYYDIVGRKVTNPSPGQILIEKNGEKYRKCFK